MRDQQILRIMSTELVTLRPLDPANKAQQILESGRIHHLPVVDGGKLVGIVSSSDLLKLYLLDDGVTSTTLTTVDQIMGSDPVVIESTYTLRDAAEKLSAGGYHSLPVIDAERMLVGIVTSTDLIDHLLQQLPRDDGSIADVSIATLQARNQVLEDVCHAAQLYMRSGHAEQEHSRLLKALDAARATSERVNL